jgi:hypothetical protein
VIRRGKEGERKDREILIKVQVIQSRSRPLEGISLAFTKFREKKEEDNIINPFLFQDFKLKRYIIANLESGVHKACSIDLII